MREEQEILKRSDENKLLSKEIIRLSQEVAALSKQNAAYITGDSFCVVTFERYKKGSDTVLVTVCNEGKNPLYELTGMINDVGEGFKGKVYDDFAAVYEDMKKTPSFRFQIIPAGQSILIALEFPFFNKTHRKFNIVFNSTIGNFYQFYREIQVEDQWKKAIKVFKNDPNVPLYEKVDPGFPRDKKRRC